MTQFSPRRSRALSRETYTQAADNWARMCSQLDDYARAGNEAGVTRMLNRLYRSVEHLRERHQLDPDEAFRNPFNWHEHARRVAE